MVVFGVHRELTNSLRCHFSYRSPHFVDNWTKHTNISNKETKTYLLETKLKNQTISNQKFLV